MNNKQNGESAEKAKAKKKITLVGVLGGTRSSPRREEGEKRLQHLGKLERDSRSGIVQWKMGW